MNTTPIITRHSSTEKPTPLKKLIYFLLVIVAGYQQKNLKYQYIKNSHFLFCDRMLKLGQKSALNDLSGHNVTYKKQVGTYYISCGEPGAFFLGAGDHNPTLLINEASFSLSQDSTVNSLEGVWYPDLEDGLSNDLQKARHEIEQHLGKASTIRPAKWSFGSAELSIGTQRLKHSINVKYVSASVDQNDS